MSRSAVTNRIWSLLLVCGVCLGCAESASAWSYHSFDYGYSISFPDDWSQIPEEIVAGKLADLPMLAHPGAKMDVGFQPKRSGQALEYPYILVEVLPYSQLGIPQQVNDPEMKQIVKRTTGLDPANPFTPETQVVEGGGELETLDGVLRFDTNSHRFTWSASNRHSDAGLVRTSQWGYFGKEVMVQVTLFEKGRGSERLRDMARAVAGSFKFEIGREYQPAFTLADAFGMTRQLIAAPNLGMVVTLICVFTGVLFAIIALLANRRHSPAYQHYDVFDRDR